MKGKRQQEILRIIEEQDIDTQDQLLAELRARGLQSTQATISRDIKELHLIKELTGYGTYRYAVSERKASLNVASRLRTISRRGSSPLIWPRTSLCSRPCREWHRRPAQPLTAWRSQDWWAVLRGTIPRCWSCAPTRTRRSSATRSTQC